MRQNRILIYIKFEPSGTPNGSFAFIDTDGCQRAVNVTIQRIGNRGVYVDNSA